MSAAFGFHREAAAELAAGAEEIFRVLDDHERLAAHMRKPSLMMAGGAMTVQTDSRRGQAVGSVIRMGGRVLGIRLRLEEVVIERQPPFHKAWETRGEPQLLVIGRYRMGFDLTPGSASGPTRLRVWIDYDLPVRLFQRWLGKCFASSYAGWCVRKMVADARQALSTQARA